MLLNGAKLGVNPSMLMLCGDCFPLKLILGLTHLVLQFAKRTSFPLTPDQLPRFLALSPTIPLRQKVLNSYFSSIFPLFNYQLSTHS